MEMVKDVKKILALVLCSYLAYSISASRVSDNEYDGAPSAKTYDMKSFVKEPDEGSSVRTPESYKLPASNATMKPFPHTIYEKAVYESFTGEQKQEKIITWNPLEDIYDLNENDIYDNLSFDLENAEQLAVKRVPGQVIIKFKDPDDVHGKEKLLQHEIDKMEKIGYVAVLDAFVVRINEMENDPNATLNRLKNNRFIEYVEPDYIWDYSLTPNDHYFTTQSLILNRINAPNGWDITTGDNGPIIAVIDSGLALHDDLPKPYSGFSADSSLAYGNDKVGHGTNVTGVLGAIGNNGIGTAGINWNANIMGVKVDDASGAINTSNVAKGIIWAADNGAKVINISIGLNTDSAMLKDAIDYAFDKGCAIFAATGNSGGGSALYPARYGNVMGVGATGDGKTRILWSNYGDGLDVVATASFFTTTKVGGYASISGTSVASPQVAGLASLILALNPSATPDAVYSYIRQGAQPLGGGYNKETGYGLIDIGNTLSLVVSDKTLPPIQLYTKPPVITLNGFTEINLFVNDNYEETGYVAVDCFGVDISDYIQITSSLDTSKAGVYTITYFVTDNGGNTATATRIITVSAKPIEPPTITLVGSNPIILHLNSVTPYIEQSAKAFDSDGEDISRKIEVIGLPDRSKEGTYTVTYRVVGKDGGVAVATRTVLIIGPYSQETIRAPYLLNGQIRQGDSITYTNIVADNSGWINLKVGSISNKMEIRVVFIDIAGGRTVITDNISSIGDKQYMINNGSYKVVVTATRITGIGKYSIDLLMPETTIMGYEEDEIAR